MGKVSYDGNKVKWADKEAAIPLPSTPLLMAAFNSARSKNPLGLASDPAAQELALQKSLLAWEEQNPESAMNRLKTKLNFMDMVAIDPALQKFPPEQVAEAFNQIMDLAPRAATKPLLIKGLVQRYLEQGGLDPFDVVSNVVKAEQELFNMEPNFGKGKAVDQGVVPGMNMVNYPHMLNSARGTEAKNEKEIQTVKPQQKPTATRNTDKQAPSVSPFSDSQMQQLQTLMQQSARSGAMQAVQGQQYTQNAFAQNSAAAQQRNP